MIKKTTFLIILGLLSVSQLNASGILQGLALETPIIRATVDDYVAGRGDEPCKLVIGAGHIENPDALHSEYLPDGGNSLTESLQGGYEFHKHEGWYAFSAETDEPFGSDMVGNIRTSSHQKAIFVPNTWDIIWDESYHPSVLSAQNLFENAFASMKTGGLFVFTLPIYRVSDYIATGHECDEEIDHPQFNESLAYQNLSNHFSSLGEAEEFVRSNLQIIGFSEVSMHKSALLKAAGVDFIEDLPEENIAHILSSSTTIAANIAANRGENPLLAIDEIFAHTGGMYYFVAKK
ncbi:MAG: hypothetical protein WCJ92_00510 [Alphaproteobacteria bacterium]